LGGQALPELRPPLGPPGVALPGLPVRRENGSKTGKPARILELEMIRFDYACKKCEKTFTVWSDEARICAYCGSKRVFKVFLTPPAAVTGNAARIDKLAERQLEAAGLSNYTNAGGTIRRTRKTHPSELAAVAAAKAHNVPFEIVTGPQGRPLTQPLTVNNPIAQAIAARGKGQVTHNPRGSGALVKQVMDRARVINPLDKMTGERRYHKDAKQDVAIVQSLMGKK
jgi:DNA-directed RNA polymerase subunit RPC12/RpoP